MTSDLTTAYMVGLEKGRDEAAELKAAVTEYWNAYDTYHNMLRRLDEAEAADGTWDTNLTRLQVAEAALRRLVGMEES